MMRGEHRSASRVVLEREQHVPRRGVGQADLRADLETESPPYGTIDFADHQDTSRVKHGEVARLQRSLREVAHQRRSRSSQRLDRLVAMRQLEDLQRQRIAIVLLANVAAPTKRIDHSKKLARRTVEQTRDLVQREPFCFAGQQL